MILELREYEIVRADLGRASARLEQAIERCKKSYYGSAKVAVCALQQHMKNLQAHMDKIDRVVSDLKNQS